MSKRTFSEQNKEFVEQLYKYNSVFGHGFVPQRDMILDVKDRQHCYELMKKSCEENHDYVAEEYNIDVEHMKKHCDVIYD